MENEQEPTTPAESTTDELLIGEVDGSGRVLHYTRGIVPPQSTPAESTPAGFVNLSFCEVDKDGRELRHFCVTIPGPYPPPSGTPATSTASPRNAQGDDLPPTGRPEP